MSLRTVETQRHITVRAHDGLRLAATLVTPATTARRAVLMLHGEGATREQDGFYPRLASDLAGRGATSLRLDLPGHGESEGRQEELSLSGLLNIIGAGLAHLRENVPDTSVALVATGLTGGVAAGYAARKGPEVDRLVLLNPLIDYKEHFVDAQPAWTGDFLDEPAARTLSADGRLALSPTFAVGRAMLNEVFWLQPRGVLGMIAAPTLIVHGAGPTDVPVESSRAAADALTCSHRLVEITGPQRDYWQAPVIRVATDWIIADN
ncbi:alpha/beta hydrolase [Kutzneria sp. CA-103260]|uniref:alpha/beta hydrolase n=1 Tax=Kutzneria sp. CA-103260 TaxID=2802641 RepID=UPI001BA6996B|nr:alpha/beta fold hydrolase [Kutzneria sp. CA-103260]QUQ64190.1 alpha/beta hydrolase [Kutzneria sp. CA-103260]